MKRLIKFLSIGLLASSAHAQQSFVQTGESIVLPFEATIALLQSSQVVSELEVLTSASGQARGVAGKEVLLDELVGLQRDMSLGLVRGVHDVRQPGLKELFLEIEDDQKLLKRIDSEIKSGTRLEKMFTMIAVSLLKK